LPRSTYIRLNGQYNVRAFFNVILDSTTVFILSSFFLQNPKILAVAKRSIHILHNDDFSHLFCNKSLFL
jgi:hypothetical protein